MQIGTFLKFSLLKGRDKMELFGSIKVGTWFSYFNSWHIFKKISENFAVSSNGELQAFLPSDKIVLIK
jgi:hypothetical protein